MQDSIADHGQHVSDRKKGAKKRRAAQEAVARALGYMPTDSDSLSSHDKKRLYLDCLEQYVNNLHAYMVAIGIQPVPIERVSSGRGLTSRSIRTLLVYLQMQASTLNNQNQELQLQLSSMRAFANHGGSDLGYIHAFDNDDHSLGLKPSLMLTSMQSECCNAPTVYNLYHNGASSIDPPISPLSSYVPGGENPSYIVPAQMPATSALVATSMLVPMSTLSSTPNTVQLPGSIPSSLGPGLSSNDSAQRVTVQGRLASAIETTPPPYDAYGVPFQQRQLEYPHQSILQGHFNFTNEHISPTPMQFHSNSGAMQQVQQQRITSVYSPSTDVVVPSSAFVAEHTTPPNVIFCDAPAPSTPPVVVPSNATLVASSYRTVCPPRWDGEQFTNK